MGNSESEAWNVLEVKQASLTNEQTKGGGGGVATRGQGGRGGCWTLASLPCGLISQKGVCLMVPKPRPVTDCSQEQRLWSCQHGVHRPRTMVLTGGNPPPPRPLSPLLPVPPDTTTFDPPQQPPSVSSGRRVASRRPPCPSHLGQQILHVTTDAAGSRCVRVNLFIGAVLLWLRRRACFSSISEGGLPFSKQFKLSVALRPQRP